MDTPTLVDIMVDGHISMDVGRDLLNPPLKLLLTQKLTLGFTILAIMVLVDIMALVDCMVDIMADGLISMDVRRDLLNPHQSPLLTQKLTLTSCMVDIMVLVDCMVDITITPMVMAMLWAVSKGTSTSIVISSLLRNN